MNRLESATTQQSPGTQLPVELCPWCGSKVSRAKFLQIQNRIRQDEEQKLAEHRKKLELQMQAQLQKKVQEAESKAKQEAQKSLRATLKEKSEAVKQRDQAIQELKEKEATIK